MGKIKDIIQPEIRIELNTGDKGQVNFKTDKIIGILNSVIIDSSEEIEVIIESSLGYLIFKRKIAGTEYIAPRVRIVPQEDNMRDILPFDKFKINEELLITIMGLKNTKVTLIFRMDSYL